MQLFQKSFQLWNNSNFNLGQLKLKSLFLSGLIGYNIYQEYRNQSQCCGIIGILTKKDNKNVVKDAATAIHDIQNRGYDSGGVFSLPFSDGVADFRISKYSNQESRDPIKMICNAIYSDHKEPQCLIGHTRWATCGVVSAENSHPHIDYTGRIALVHNGTLTNYKELQQELQQEGIQMKSQTDSELIAHLISKQMQQNQGYNVKKALESVICSGDIKGQWGLAIIDRQHPTQMVVACQGSSIFISAQKGYITVASESSALQAEEYFPMKDGEIIELDVSSDNSIVEKSRIIQNEFMLRQELSKQYKSYFEQEINDQFNSVFRTIGLGSRLACDNDTAKLGGLEKYEEQICSIDDLIILACGSSYYASNFALHYLQELQCFNTVSCVIGSDVNKYTFPRRSKAGVVLVSQSGETFDLNQALDIAKEQNLFSMGIINKVGSRLASKVDCGIYLNCGIEVAVAATKSFVSQVVGLLMMSIWISKKTDKQNESQQLRQQIYQSLLMLPGSIQQTIKQVKEECRQWAEIMQTQNSLLVLGKGSSSYIAKEGALKLKELTYIHAEAYTAGELKHGTLALVNADVPKSTCVILIILDDQEKDHMNLCLSEVHSRHAQTFVITDNPSIVNKDKAHHILQIKNCGVLTPLLAVLPFQILTAQIGYLKEIDIDRPRNLAKCVTTG